ncbi:hypothetical protein DFQ26_002408 [Actinomortierella ambigua]|nr:hypothetical protein DFQ26_002408 [Actinomortierella ambigua]
MTNPAVLAWLQEIAAAKSAAAAKQASQGAAPATTPATSSTVAVHGADQTSSSNNNNDDPLHHPPPRHPPRYGIFEQYSLKTHGVQYTLKLPPPPRKPDPGECCGNDCVPCINTLYWEDVARHRRIVARLEREFKVVVEWQEQEQGGGGAGEETRRVERIELVQEGQYQVLASMELVVDATKREGATGTEQRQHQQQGQHSQKGSTEKDAEDMKNEIEREEEEQEEEEVGEGDAKARGLSVRAYRPFRILEKTYVKHDTLRIVCDVEAPLPTRDMATFHVLIRFKHEDGRIVTKAFTPVAPNQELPSPSPLLSPSSSSSPSSSPSADSPDNIETTSTKNDDAVTVGGARAVVAFNYLPTNLPSQKHYVGISTTKTRALQTTTFTTTTTNRYQNKLTFLIKLYPPPHETSALWRAIPDVILPPPLSKAAEGEVNGQGQGNEAPVLYMRGPIHTAGFRLQDDVAHLVMIAAGSGITPMFQVLQAFQRRQWERQMEKEEKEEKEEEKEKEEENGKEKMMKDRGTGTGKGKGKGKGMDENKDKGNKSRPLPVVMDLIFCNRTAEDIWLREEIVRAATPTQIQGRQRRRQEGDDLKDGRLTPAGSPSCSASASRGVNGTTKPSTSWQTTEAAKDEEGEEDEEKGRGDLREWTASIHHVLSSSTAEEAAAVVVEAPEIVYHGRLQQNFVKQLLDRTLLLQEEGDQQQPTPSSTNVVSSDTYTYNPTEALSNRSMTTETSTWTRSVDKRLVQILVCGPPSFNRDMERYLSVLGYTSATLGCEVYVFD